jgi:hypothetical protein
MALDDGCFDDPFSRVLHYTAVEFGPLADTLEKVRSLHISSDRDVALGKAVTRLLREAVSRRDPKLPPGAGNRREGRILLVVGESGAGKTTTVEKVLSSHPALRGYAEVGSGCPLIRAAAPAPCTLNQLGRAISAALGYPYLGGTKENVVWDGVRRLLVERRILSIYIDELNNLTENANVVERRKVRDTLKSLCVDKDWPISLILSGLPSIEAFFGEDTQVERRERPIRFERLQVPDDVPLMANILRQLAELVNLASPANGDSVVAPRRDCNRDPPRSNRRSSPERVARAHDRALR